MASRTRRRVVATLVSGAVLIMAAPAVALAEPSVGTSSVQASARTVVGSFLGAVARGDRAAATRRTAPVAPASVLWSMFRAEFAYQSSLPTSPPASGGAWRRAGLPWAAVGTPRCYGAWCAVHVSQNAQGADLVSLTVYTRKAGTVTRIVGARGDGPQDGIDFSSRTWACTHRAVRLTQPLYDGSGRLTSSLNLTLAARSLLRVGTYYGQVASDPTRGVAYRHVVQGYVPTAALRRVPATVRTEARATAWCSAHG